MIDGVADDANHDERGQHGDDQQIVYLHEAQEHDNDQAPGQFSEKFAGTGDTGQSFGLPDVE